MSDLIFPCRGGKLPGRERYPDSDSHLRLRGFHFMDPLLDALYVVSRILHIGTAIVAVGGTVFMRFVLMPAAKAALSQADHDNLRARVMGTWKRVGFSPVSHLVCVKEYTSRKGYTRSHHEVLYLLAKGWSRAASHRSPCSVA